MLHVLLHMAQREGPVTSEDMAHMMSSHPVVVRRVMAGLRDSGYVRSEKGHGGGWSLACDLHALTLRDVYDALGAPEPFAMGHRADAPGCLVEQVVNAALDDAFKDAEALLLERFAHVTLASLADDFGKRLVAHHGHPGDHHHAP